MEAPNPTIRTERTMPLSTALMQLVGVLAASPPPAVPNGTPVRWIPDPRFPLASLAECEALRRTRPVLGPDQAGLQLSTEAGRPAIACTTVEEWIAGREAGGVPYSTFDITVESHFIHAAAWYALLPRLTPSVRSTWPATSSGLGTRCIELLRESVVDPAAEIAGREFALEPHGWGFRNMTPVRWEWFEPVGLGDLDGDGQEDLLGIRGCGFSQGSGRSYDVATFTRTAAGRILDISCRVPLWSATAADLASDRKRWLASCGWPENEELALRGTLSTVDGKETLTLMFRVMDGYVSGSVRIGNGNPVLIDGCLGRDSEMHLEEFPDGRVQAAAMRLRWHRDGNLLSIDGLRFPRGEIEGDRLRLEGQLPAGSSAQRVNQKGSQDPER
jgi:hypothetical protein